jgi:hypothetical protein
MLERSIVSALLAFSCAAVLAAPPGRMFKCVDAQGKTYYTQVPPAECQGRSTQELSGLGRVVKENEVLTPAQAAAREAEAKKKAEAEKLADELRRKNTALLNTYSSEKDIDEARARALKQAEGAIKVSEKKIADSEKRRGTFEKEKEFYVKKPLPSKLQQDIQDNERDIKKEQEILESKKKEISTINVKYDEEKRRYLELTRPRK